MTEIKTICKSGKKATMNARLDENGNRVTEGEQISIGLNYEAQARDIFELDKVSPIGYQGRVWSISQICRPPSVTSKKYKYIANLVIHRTQNLYN